MKYMPHLVWLVALAFIIIFGFAGILDEKTFVSGFVTLTATLMGGVLLYLWNSEEQDKVRTRHEVGAINRALLVLARQVNVSLQLAEEFAVYPNNYLLAFGYPPRTLPAFLNMMQKFEDLEFILEDEPDLVFRLTIQQERFEQMVNAFHVRANFHATSMKAEWERLGLGSELPLEQALIKIIDPQIHKSALKYTSQMTEHVKLFQLSAKDEIAALNAFDKKRYPGRKLIDFYRRN